MMVLNRKIIILMSCISLLLCIVTLQDTYAKYLSSANGTTDISIARWRILVNDFDVRNSITSNSLITPVFSGNNHIAENVVAPTANGYFDIIIDGNDTDISFNYTININTSEDSLVQDIVTTGYQVDGGEIITSSSSNISGTILLNDLNKVKTIRIYITWVDQALNQDETMNNQDDTNATKELNAVAKLDVNVNFIQIIN